MDSDLEYWQSRLESHFKELLSRRSREAPDRPIFGLEHGLDNTELNNLIISIQTHIKEHSPCWEHRLVWVVYSSEFGYMYAGDEYWQTFEKQTPGWELNGDRHWIRRCFQDFHEHFGGAKPTGAWARHFSIICWPITHAILPRDLQRQLARKLYDLRHALLPEVLESPRRLGELITVRSWNTSSRFQQLTEEPLFLGQIATALLLQGNGSEITLIHPSTLIRISADVDRERSARVWLRRARVSAQRRIRFTHIRGQGIERDLERTTTSEETDSVSREGLEPRLILRPLDSSRWEILLELPDFSLLPLRFRRLREVLAQSRCQLTGSSGRPLARGRLLHGPQRVILKNWPRHDEPLLKFENPSPELDRLLRTENLLRPGPVWLFKVAADGLAYELKSACIRPSHKYIVLIEKGTSFLAHSVLTPVQIECDGIQGVELQFADTITPEQNFALSALGISQATTIHVWPVGLAAAQWDGEGVGEWISTDIPRLGIRADHHVTAISVDLGFDKLDVSPSPPGNPVFIELPEFDPGVYTADINATNSDGNITEFGKLRLIIREPRAWSSGQSKGDAILVEVDPTTPSLEQMWEGKVEIQVHGPMSRKAYCEISFIEGGGSRPFFHKKLPPLSLPIDADNWRKYWDTYFKKDLEVQNAYDLAQTCRICLAAGELGTFILPLEREFSPLRWAVQRTRDSFLLRLLDDRGSDQAPVLSRFEFDYPDIKQPLDVSLYTQTTGAKASAGLYVAHTSDYQPSIIIPPEVHTFLDLNITSRITKRNRTAADIIALISLIELWGCARITGNVFSLILRKRILFALVQGLFHLIAGDPWIMWEYDYHGHKYNGIPLLQSVWHALNNRQEIEIAEKIATNIHEFIIASPRKRLQQLALLSAPHLFIRTRQSSDVEGDQCINPPLIWLSELALRLASGSVGTIRWAGEKLNPGISCLLETPSLARVARFLVLALDQLTKKSDITSDLYEEWVWE